MTDKDLSGPVLSVQDLSVVYETGGGVVHAVTDVSFDLNKGETLGVVGESGCGKSTAAMAILQLLNPPGRISAGSVMLNGVDLTRLDADELRRVRWTQLALIPQGAMNSLNPTMTVGAQLSDTMRTHRRQMRRRQRNHRISELLELVGLPERSVKQYPHELSGGMKQRVCIAMAVALEPDVIIADEATSALDVVVQRRVAQTLIEVKQRLSVSMIMIGHDMGLMAQVSDRLMVMYAGRIVETGPTAQLLSAPAHHYTQMLIDALPGIDSRRPLKVVDGIMHDPRQPPPGCIFQLRCPSYKPACRHQVPAVTEVSSDRLSHQVYCHFPLLRGTGADR